MFSTKLSRAAHRATTTSSTTISISTSTACISCLADHRPSHQRRHSSSKTSVPPDNNTSKAAPATKASAGEDATAPASEERQQPHSRSSKGRARGGYRKVGATQTGTEVKDVKKAVPAEPVDQFAGLPSVPSIQNLDTRELSLSSFFSLHRPISVTTALPAPTTPENFNTLFATTAARQAAENPWEHGNSAERRPEDVIYTLHNTIQSLETGVQNAEEDGVRWEIIHESSSNSNGDGVKHLDGAPRMKNLDELVAQFKPFRAPPPPQPFPEASEPQGKKSATGAQKGRGRAKQKTFTATITVTESTDSHGQKSYTASSSPIVRLPEPVQGQSTIRDPRRWQPFLVRMRTMRTRRSPTISTSRLTPGRRSEEGRVRGVGQERMKMYLISVKRQRRLKMKKHKYKKLMKRTRTLRRKLERN